MIDLGWILFGIFLFVTFVFVVIALFLPEWVGITGKKAKQYMEEHQESKEAKDPKEI